jgi:chromosome partitioning protein
VTATVYAVANQKGGVAKTTTTIAVAAALVERDLAVLVVDLDPQACATFSLGYDPDSLDLALHDVIGGRAGLADTVLQHAEIDTLRDTYDAILLDCPPSLGVLTLNGLTAADRAIIPVQCETLSHRGVSQLLEIIADVQRLYRVIAAELAGLDVSGAVRERAGTAAGGRRDG